ncbi:MAG: efflux RND transporter periplasmic adaptor subunit, partial [Alphaproteobacteria bacterium]
HDGVIAHLNVREGAFVKPGETIMTVQDYSSVWVRASVAEKDLALLGENASARLHFPSLPGQEIPGKVDYIHPTVDPQSRTGKVRLVIDNPNGALRPGAYAHVVFDVEKQRRLAVPSEAILRDSRGAYVVKALGNGRFRPVRIEDGVVSHGRTEILGGLKMGENIVVSGQFLIDSESALRESFHKLQGTQTSLALLELTPEELSLMDHYVDAALYLHEVMTKGQDVTPHYLDAALQAGGKLKSRFGGTRLETVLEEAAEGVRAAQKARSESELAAALGTLTKALKPWLMEGKPAHYKKKGLTLAADHDSGRLWLQQGQELQNPYGGPAHEVPWPEETADTAETAPQKAAPKQSGTGHDH